MTSYCGGRFTVPPGFDFKILPQKSKNVVVISFIGSMDSFNKKSSTQLVENFLQRSPFSLPCTDSVIEGYYDCERHLIFLHYRDSENLLTDLLLSSNDYENVLEKWDSERLKHLFFLFAVSHFIVITTFGISLDPKYISLFKLLNRLSHHLYPTMEQLLRSLPLPRYCISIGRLMAPRLLFVFKLPPTIVARKLAEDENTLRDLERNLTYQIFNVFHESGLLEFTSAENRLFELMGYNYVRVLLPDVVEPLVTFSEPYGQCDKDDLAQHLLETLISALGVPSLMEGSEFMKDCRIPPPRPLYPPPGAPDDRSFSAFLQCHITSLLEDTFRGEHMENYTPYTFELPTCKGWFTTCYKLYTSLFDDTDPSLSSSSEHGANPCLGRQWRHLFSSNENGETASVTLFSTQAQLDRQLSSTRCEIALNAAEAHYRQDLPTHYSRTFHLAKVVSSYNVFLRFARGPCVVPTLERLTRRLARLYLAGRVGCPAVMVSGAACRQELHTLPERFPGIANALRSLEPQPQTDGGSGDGDNGGDLSNPHSAAECLIKHIKSVLEGGAVPFRKSRSMKNRNVQDNILSNCLQDVPIGLVGGWRLAWIEAAVEVMMKEKNQPHSNDRNVSDKADSLHHLSVMPHRSDRRYISYCSCGRLQALRPDPFDYQEANWEFYNALEMACCNKVSGIPLAPHILSNSMHNFCTILEDKSVEEIEQPDSLLKFTPSSLSLQNRRRVIGSDDEEDGTGVGLTREMNSRQAEVEGMEEKEEVEVEAEAEAEAEEEVEEEESTRDKLDFESAESNTSSGASALASLKYASIESMSQDSDRNLLARTRRSKVNTPNLSEGYVEEEKVLEVPSSGDALGDSAQKGNEELVKPTSVAGRENQRIPVMFFSGMPVLGQPIGTIPLYPSWAIHAIGKYFSYSHSSGMALPGFLRGSQFLLPWDVQLSRPTPMTGTPKTRTSRPRDTDTVKLFLGFEMECPMGHRFFLAGPDRPMLGTMQGGDVRRSVSNLLSCDLSLYLPCRCSSTLGGAKGEAGGMSSMEAVAIAEDDGKKAGEVGGGNVDGDRTVWAQLMRIFVAIPSAPIRVRFAPVIRPGPVDSNVHLFHLGRTLDQEIDAKNPVAKVSTLRGIDRSNRASNFEKSTLSSGLDEDPGYVYLENGNIWVVRLPFAYQFGDIIYRRPKDPKQITECCLIRGSLSVEEL